MRVPLTVALLVCLAACTLRPADTGRLDTVTRPYSPLATQDPPLISASADAFTREAFRTSDGSRLPYRLLSPIAPHGKAPLIIVLHGSGAMGADNTAQMGAFARSWAQPAVVARFRAFVAIPQVPVRSADYEAGADGLLASRPGESLAAVLELIDSLASSLPVDRSRVYVVGFSMGGSAALNALVLKPDRFAAAVTFSAVPPDRSLAPQVARIPVMLVHGTADTENPIAPDRAWAEALATSGGRPRFITYEGMDHRIPPDMLEADNEWRTWLLRQHR